MTGQRNDDTAQSWFDARTLCASVPCGYFEYQQVSAALQHPCDGRGLLFGKSPDQLLSILLKYAVVEHEFFHCRSILSTSFGYLYHLIHRFLAEARIGLLRRDDVRSSLYAQRSRKPIDMLQGFSSTHPAIYELTSLFRWMCSDDILMRFSIEKAATFEEIVSPFRSGCIEAPSNAGNVDAAVPLLTRVRLTDHCRAVAREPLFDTSAILEAFAIWKEYATLSISLWYRHPWMFALLDQWRKTWISSYRYASVLDTFAQVIGCNASMALPGVLLDISLSGPILTWGDLTWSECHPSLRLAQLLKLADSLPRRFRVVDNCDLVEGFYEDVESFVSRQLGWRPVRDNVQNMCIAVGARGQQVQSLGHYAGRVEPLGHVGDRRFQYAALGRLMDIGAFLFPWTHRGMETLGLITCPPVVVFDNELHIYNTFREPEAVYVAFMYRIVCQMLVQCMLNDQLSPPDYRQVRWLYALMANRWPTGVPEASFDPKQSFEDFASELLGFEYGNV